MNWSAAVVMSHSLQHMVLLDLFCAVCWFLDCVSQVVDLELGMCADMEEVAAGRKRGVTN